MFRFCCCLNGSQCFGNTDFSFRIRGKTIFYYLYGCYYLDEYYLTIYELIFILQIPARLDIEGTPKNILPFFTLSF